MLSNTFLLADCSFVRLLCPILLLFCVCLCVYSPISQRALSWCYCRAPRHARMFPVQQRPQRHYHANYIVWGVIAQIVAPLPPLPLLLNADTGLYFPMSYALWLFTCWINTADAVADVSNVSLLVSSLYFWSSRLLRVDLLHLLITLWWHRVTEEKNNDV